MNPVSGPVAAANAQAAPSLGAASSATADARLPLVPAVSFRSLLFGAWEPAPEVAAAPSLAPLAPRLAAGMPSHPVAAMRAGSRASAAADPQEPRSPVAAGRGPEDDLALGSIARRSRDSGEHLLATPVLGLAMAPHLDVRTNAPAPPAPRALASMEDLLPALVRRVAWSGDGHRGSMRLELGAGALAGGTLLVHADAGRVSVHLDVPPGADAAGWQRRLQQRLASKGISADVVEVT